MPGDFSRNSVNPPKNYCGVLMQQGRVQVDADWNEQLALQLQRTFTEAGDLIGACGTPKQGNGFRIDTMPGDGDLIIEPGRFYVNGLLCENNPQRQPVTFPAGAKQSSPLYVHYVRMTSPAQRHVPIPGWNESQGQVNVASLVFDGRKLCVGDWVKLSAPGVKELITRITAIGCNTAATDPDSITPNYYTLTLEDSVYSFRNAHEAWMRRVVTFTTQPYLFNQSDAALETPASPPEALDLPEGDYLLALDAWIREADALEDPHIREVALGGPDTGTRLQTAWQVHLVPLETTPSGSPLPSSPPSGVDCCTDFPAWDNFKAALKTTGLMNAQAPPPTTTPPCQLPASAGYLGLANQLYRVEIFQPGHYDKDATFVWSRDNGMVETPLVCVDTNGAVYVNSLGTDDLHSFGLGNWVEIYDRTDELMGAPRFLAQITIQPGGMMTPPCAGPGAAQAYQLTITPLATQFSGRSGLFLRRWDMPAGTPTIGIPIVPGWIQLENNIEVNFSDGYYATRSYWQVPARTATGDIEWPPYAVPNINPIPQPPLEPQHYFCRLATLSVSSHGGWMLADCRRLFPSLAHICADDICFHGDGCELQPVNTVQDAIEELRARLRYHSKMLHGAGVVSGLAVNCLSRSSVLVKQGYAIDCNGYDLILKNDSRVDLSSLIPLSPSEHIVPDGDYELILERGSESRVLEVAGDRESNEGCGCASSAVTTESCFSFKVIPCEPQSLKDEVLQGTLLIEFYNKCIRSLADAYKKDYTNVWMPGGAKLLSKSQALLSSAISLLYPLVQSNANLEVYISPQEHIVLRDFFQWVVSRLRDRTFCALKDSVPQYPEYAVAGKATTIFSKGMSKRLRVDPTGKRVVAVGSDANVYVYNLATGDIETVGTIPPTTTGWVVQDVAFNADGTQIYTIATNSNDSMFAIGTISGDGMAWSNVRSLGALSFATMVWDTELNGLFAVATGQGFYSINPTPTSGNGLGQLQGNGLGVPAGHLVTSGGLLYLTVTLAGTAGSGGAFNAVQRYAANGAITGYNLPQGVTGNLTDDLLVNGDSAWVTATSAAGKEIYTFKAGDGVSLEFSAPLNDNTTVRLAYNSELDAPMITFEDTCQIQTFGVGSPLALTPYYPTEVHPNSIAAIPAGDHAGGCLVLNTTSNTINLIPKATPAFEDDADLDQYRTSAIQAFIGLCFPLLQHLKDCFCDLLLPKVPSCGDSDRGDGVSLGCITFVDGSVYKICNLEKRTYVKTFPTVGHWLSLIPVIPLVRTLFERFCCMDLTMTNLTNTVVPKTAKYNLNYDPATARAKIGQIQNFKLSDQLSAVGASFKPVGQFAGDGILSQLRAQAAPAPAVASKQILEQPVAGVRSALAASNVNVIAETTYDPTKFLQNARSYAAAPSSVPSGSSVTLVTDSSGNVKYYIVGSAAETQLNTAVLTNKQQIDNITATDLDLKTGLQAVQQAELPVVQNVAGLQALVTGLQTQLVNAQTASAQALAQRDQQIANLTATTQQLQTKLQTVETLSAQVQALTLKISPPAKG